MESQVDRSQTISLPPVFIVSGGLGSSGEQLVRTSLAQFQNIDVPIKLFSNMTNKPIETTADEVVALVTRRLENKPR